MLYTLDMVPGYAAIFCEVDGDLSFCTYLISGGKYGNDDLHRVHHDLLANDPHIRSAIGPEAQIEKMRGDPLRIGGVEKLRRPPPHRRGHGRSDRSAHRRGIHHAMDAAEIAARVLDRALAEDDLSASSRKRYHDGG